MASSSTSSVSKSFKYDVFLSFRGEDTRKNFIDHLYYALQQNGISTYKDDERIEKGKRISDELMGSIEDTKVFIVVFSKNYASSSWCLNELLKIMECHKTTKHAIYPVFYDVEPSEVRNQTGAVGEAFARHEKEEAAGEWRKALKEAADVAGWELKNTADGHEAKLIRLIVEKLSLELRDINVHFDENLVGMETRIKDILSSLETASEDDVRMIGIWGMGGGGKTTLARALFDQISFQFEGKSFVENVREVSNSPLSGLKSLQRQILSNVLDNHNINVDSVSEGKNMMRRMMRGRKVLLVLDDVDHGDQLEALAGDPSWFKAGSIIIITTRDEQVLLAHKVNLIHSTHLLSDKEAMWLCSRYAFGREIPIEGYEELSRQVVCYGAGLPLTIKVLGSFLCGKHKREWVDALARLKTIPLEETQKKLELSYIGLDDEYKEIFLHIATMLKGFDKITTIEALESRGFHAIIGLRVLQQKALITFYNNNGYEYVGMHDHLEEMGRNIVRLSHSDKHSRLWDSKETKDILAGNLGTEATKCIYFFIESLDLKVFLNGLRKMKELLYLHVDTSTMDPHPVTNIFIPTSQTLRFMCCNLKYNEVIPYFPESLRYLRWDGYPFRYLPKTFQANNLVGLHLIYNNLVQLWEGGSRKVLYKLRFLTFIGRNLRAFDLRLTPNLERLRLEGYGELVEFYMPVECLKLSYLRLTGVKLGTFDIGLTPNLEELYLEDTDLVELRTLDIGLTRNLKYLDVSHCDNLEELHMPDECVNLKSLFLTGLKLRTLNLAPSPSLERLDLRGCNDLEEFHIAECPILTYIDISALKLRTLDLRLVPNLSKFFSRCEGLVELHMPDECVNLKSLFLRGLKLRTLNLAPCPNLESLDLLHCNDLEEFHIAECPILTDIKITALKLRTLDLRLVPNLSNFISKCEGLVELHLPSRCLNLNKLDVSNSKLRTLNIGLAPILTHLDFENCCDLEELHLVDQCQKLLYLDCSCSKLRTLDLGRTPNLKELYLEGSDLVELHAPMGCLKNIVRLDLSGCLGFSLFTFLLTENDDTSTMEESPEVGSIAKLDITLKSFPFHPDNSFLEFEFTCFHKEDLPSLTKSIEKLISGGPCVCIKFESFSRSIRGLQR